jgi:hypothetical protein
MSTARIALWTLLALIVSAVAGFVIVTLAIFGAWGLMGVKDRDGGAGMAVIFVIAPAAAMVAGLVGAVATAVVLARRRVAAPAPEPASAAADTRLLIGVVCAIAGLFVGFAAADLAKALLRPLIFKSYLAYRAHALTHLALPPVFAIVGFFLPRILRPRPG